MNTLYLLELFGPFVLIPAVPLVLATVATIRWVHDPKLLLAIAVLTSLVGTVSVAQTAFGSYNVFARRLWLVIECTELALVAVVIGLIAFRSLKIRISVTLGLLIGTFSIAFAVIATSGIHRDIAANMLNLPDGWMQTYAAPALQSSVDQVGADILTILTPAVGMVLFWLIWFRSIGRPHTSDRPHWTLSVPLVGVPVMAVVT